MKIRCDCGNPIVDQTDALPYKAHLIPDQDWFTLLDAIDDAIETIALHPQQQEREMMRLRTLVGRLVVTSSVAVFSLRDALCRRRSRRAKTVSAHRHPAAIICFVRTR